MQKRMQGHVSVPARRILGCGDSEQQLLGGAFDVQWQIPESLPGVTLCSQLPQLGKSYEASSHGPLVGPKSLGSNLQLCSP